MCIAVEETDIEGILAAINTIELIVEIRSEKNSAQLTSAIPLQCSTNWANKPTRSCLLRWITQFKKNYVFMNYSDQSFWIKSALSLVRVEVYRQGCEE